MHNGDDFPPNGNGESDDDAATNPLETPRGRIRLRRGEVSPFVGIHSSTPSWRQAPPLHSVLQGWQNALPKLYKYSPEQLQVVYHRGSSDESSSAETPSPRASSMGKRSKPKAAPIRGRIPGLSAIKSDDEDSLNVTNPMRMNLNATFEKPPLPLPLSSKQKQYFDNISKTMPTTAPAAMNIESDLYPAIVTDNHNHRHRIMDMNSMQGTIRKLDFDSSDLIDQEIQTDESGFEVKEENQNIEKSGLTETAKLPCFTGTGADALLEPTSLGKPESPMPLLCDNCDDLESQLKIMSEKYQRLEVRTGRLEDELRLITAESKNNEKLLEIANAENKKYLTEIQRYKVLMEYKDKELIFAKSNGPVKPTEIGCNESPIMAMNPPLGHSTPTPGPKSVAARTPARGFATPLNNFNGPESPAERLNRNLVKMKAGVHRVNDLFDSVKQTPSRKTVEFATPQSKLPLARGRNFGNLDYNTPRSSHHFFPATPTLPPRFLNETFTKR